MTTLTIKRANGRAVYTWTSAPYHHKDTFGDSRTKRGSEPSLAAQKVSRRRAFKQVSDIIYLYQDLLTTFVTLTYREQHSNYEKILNDLKNYFSRSGISYIAVVERHKSGAFHVHAICSDLPDCYESDYYVDGRRQIKWRPWEKNLGITDVKFISGVDDKFRIEKYIFKYMSKSDKIGGRFFLKSRNFKVRELSSHQFRGDISQLPKWELDMDCLDRSEEFVYNVDNISLMVSKEYYDTRANTV